MKPRKEWKREPPNRDVFDPNREFPKEDPNVAWPRCDPAKEELPKVDPPKCELLKPEPAWIVEEPLDRPKECQPPSKLPALRAERPALAKPPELRPALKRAEPPELPNECHWPSLTAE